MNLHLNKKSILRKTAQVGGLTFVSRILGIFREILQVSFLGVGALSDAFIIAFRIPNFFRHIFAEGALSASFVPSIVRVVKEGNKETANGLMTLSFAIFQSAIMCMYLFVFFKTSWVVTLIAPGFSAEQAYHTILFLKILFPFLFFVSGSALFAGSLNAVNHFFVPAFGPVLLNIFYIGALGLCMVLNFSPTVLCFGIVLGGAAHLVLHIWMFYRCGFSFGKITADAILVFREIIKKFLPCLFGVSIVEVNLFVSSIVASFLPKGSVTLLYYGSRFINIPLGVFAVAFASILLSHFSRIVLHAPKRLNFYMLESVKFVSWVIIPSMIFLMLTSHDIFKAMFMLKKSAAEYVTQAQWILIIYSVGLLFFCLNKILLNIFYSLKDTRSAMLIAGAGATVNLVGDIVGMFVCGAYGIAAAAVLSGITITVLCFYFLHKSHGYTFYAFRYFAFMQRYLVHMFLIAACLVGTWWAIITSPIAWILATQAGYWFVAFSLAASGIGMLYTTRRLAGIRLYFLER